jgi:hypothetical protein
MKLFLLLLIGLPVFIACSNQQNLNAKELKEISSEDSLNNGEALKADSNKIIFPKKLTLQGITYELKVLGKGSIQQLTIIPYGLKLYNDTFHLEVEPIVGAEIEDLDHDGFPELLIYIQSAGSGSYGNVIGFSPNKGKSLSQIYFPELDKKSATMKGYMGHDEFAIVESSLARRFKIYEGTDSNARPTGKIRQLEYQLKPGEASKKFVLIKQTEIPSLLGK